MEKNFFMPKNITAPIKKKNLILIYVESLENTYSNSNMFKEDLLESINKKTPQAESFSSFKQAKGTGWTIAGIVSSQCGIPLLPTSYDGNEFGEQIKDFFPNAICLGDVLKNAGYKNIFMGGALVSFAGKGKFLRQHGYDEIYGRAEWESIGEKSFQGWGLYDDRLFFRVKEKIDLLEKSGVPYNLTVLTNDTHHPAGFISEICRKQGVTNFTGIVKCTAGILSDFIDYMEKNDYLKNTNVVIIGDHLAMANSVSDQLKTIKNRTIYNKFISSDHLEKNREDLNHFSIFPTIIYSLGFRFDNNRLALGASGFGELDPKFSIINSLDQDELSNKLTIFAKKYACNELKKITN